MASLTEIQARIDGLNQALADGIRQVTVRGQTTVYNTTDSLIKARDDAERQIAVARALQQDGLSPRGTGYAYLAYGGRG